MKKLLSILLAVVCAAGSVSFSAAISAASSSYAQLISAGFPSSYATKLSALKDKYPNWNFEPMFVGEELDEAVANERSPHSQQLIQKTSSNNSRDFYCTCSSCYKNGNYVIQEGSSWVSASESAVEYYMNPLNFFDEKYIFQFETTSYNSSQTTSGIETIIKNTWMYNSYITYKDSKGVTQTYKSSTYPNGVKYSQAILDAAKSSGTSAYYLASRIVQEVGGTTNSAGGASGTNSTYPGIYNYYNIGANTGYLDGLKWAATTTSGYAVNTDARLRSEPTTSSTHIITVPSSTKVTVLSTTGTQADGYKWYKVNVTVNSKTYSGYIRSDLVDYGDKYNRPWTNPYVSIVNGAKYIANNFSEDQNTGYLQKFNVNPESSSMHSHEYMANVQAPSSEAGNTYKAYVEAGLLSASKTFVIPVYDNTDPGITGLNVYARGNGGKSLYLEWNAVAGATSYKVYIVSGSTSYLKGTVKDTKFTFTDLTPSWEYDVIIVANDSKNSTSGIYTICAAPAPVENFDAQLLDSNTITVTWDTTSCHGYYIEWATDKNFTQNKSSQYISGSSTDSFTINTKYSADKYYVRLRTWKTFQGSYVYGDFAPVSDLTDNLILPQGFKVTSRGNNGNSLTLDWGDVSGASGYKVYIVSGDTEYFKGDIKSSSFTFTDLTPAWEYEVKVVAYSDSKSSTAFYRICAAPAAVTDFSAQVIDSDNVELTWTAQTSNGYYIEWASDSSFTKNKDSALLTSSSVTSYKMSFSNADEYYVRLRSVKYFDGEYIYSDYSQTINLNLLLPQVTGLKVTSYSNNGTSVTVDWNDVKGADGYRIYLDNKLTETVKNSGYTFSGLSQGKEYAVKVEAYTNSGRSSQSTITITAGIKDVENIQISKTSTGAVYVSWESDDCDGYKIQWATDSSFTKNTGSAQINSGKTTSYTFAEKYVNDYYFRIMAYKSVNGVTVYSNYSEPIKLSNAVAPPTGYNVYARGNGGKSLYLEWKASSNADGYKVYIVSGSTECFKGDVQNSKFTFTDLTPSWEYTVKVVAYNDYGTASSTTTVGAAPAAPTGLEAEMSGSTIKATWDVASCHGYYIQWATDESFKNVAGGEYVNGSGSTSYTIKNISSSKTYYVRVRTWKNYQGSKLYSDFSAPVKSGAKPSAPTWYNVYARGNGGKALYLDWNTISNADGYKVYIVSGSTEYFKGDVQNSKFTFTDLTPSWEYTVKVVAYNDYGSSSSTTTVGAAPAAPTGLEATSSGSTIKATWDVASCHGYYIQWATDESFKNVVGGEYINGSGSTSYTIKADTTQSYYVRVRTWKNYQGSKLYSDFSAPVKSGAKPSAPTWYNVYARGNGGKALYLDWNTISNADGYKVYIVSGDKEYLKGDVKESKFTFTDLTPSWEYTVKVVAYNDYGSSSSTTTVGAAPAAPTGLEATSSGSTIKATWDVASCHGYYIQWATDESFKNVAGGEYVNGSGSTSYTIKNISSSQTYYVRVRTWKNYQGSKLYSDFSAPEKTV